MNSSRQSGTRPKRKCLRLSALPLLLVVGTTTVSVNAASGVYQQGSHTLFYLPLDGPNAGAPEGCSISNSSLLSYIPDRFGNANSAIHVSAAGSYLDGFYIACSDTLIAASPSTSFTLGYWVQISQLPNDGANCTLGCGYRMFTILSTNGSNGGCNKYLAMDIGSGGGGLPDACQGGLNGNIGQLISSTSLGDGKWHNLVWVFDHTNDLITFYLDGVKNKTAPLPNPPYTPKSTQYLAGAENGSFALNGDMDDFWIEDHPWTAAEVAQYYGSPECGVQKTVLDTSDSHKVISGTTSGSACTWTLTVTNLEPSLWLDITETPIGTVTAVPADPVSSQYAQSGILAPGKSIVYTIQYSEPDQSVTVFANLTGRALDPAMNMNILQALIDGISVLAPVGTVELGIEDVAQILEVTKQMPHFEAAAADFLHRACLGPFCVYVPELRSGLRELEAFLQSPTEPTLLLGLLEQLGVDTAETAVTSVTSTKGALAGILLEVVGNVQIAFWGNSAGGVTLTAH